MTRPIRVGIVGAGYIAGLHSAGYRSVAGSFPGQSARVELIRAADTDRTRADLLASAWGWRESTDDWHAVTRSDDVDVVNVCVPNSLHAEIVLDALAHGKHIVCEKPLAADVESAREMVDAASTSDQLTQVCFYYRSWPAISLARQLVEEGRLGTLVHFRGWMLQDYARNPTHQMGWRIDRSQAGAGALGDLGSHIFDIARYLVGDVNRICAHARATVARNLDTPGPEDLAAVLLEFENGTSGVLEASWALTGHKADLGFDLVGSEGAIRFGWERANEVEVLTGDSESGGFERVLLGPAQPSVGGIVAVAGQGLGYRDAFTIGLGRMVDGIASSKPSVEPSFIDGLRGCQFVAAAIESATTGGWVSL
jgi:predicted dehydrogenase